MFCQLFLRHFGKVCALLRLHEPDIHLPGYLNLVNKSLSSFSTAITTIVPHFKQLHGHFPQPSLLLKVLYPVIGPECVGGGRVRRRVYACSLQRCKGAEICVCFIVRTYNCGTLYAICGHLTAVVVFSSVGAVC